MQIKRIKFRVSFTCKRAIKHLFLVIAAWKSLIFRGQLSDQTW